MISAKRLALQLTPLLDLLLIVIFAQYLEIEQTATTINQQTVAEQARQEYELKQAREQLAFTRQVLDATQQHRTQAERKLEELRLASQTEQTASETEAQELTSRLQDVSQQRDRILQVVKQLYASSSEELRKLFDQLASASNTPSPVSPEQIQALAEKVATSEPRELATFLLAYEEIRKRCDLWELHLDPQGLVHLFDGTNRHKFRAGSAEDFQRQLFDLYKSLPQTKGLVILLVSYGEVRADMRQNVLLSLPAVTERMRADAAGRTRFEYAILGFLPLQE